MRSFIKSHRQSFSGGTSDLSNSTDSENSAKPGARTNSTSPALIRLENHSKSSSSLTSINTNIMSFSSSNSSVNNGSNEPTNSSPTLHTPVPLYSNRSVSSPSSPNRSSISQRRSDVFDTSKLHGSTGSHPLRSASALGSPTSSTSLKKLNPISYIRRRRTSNDGPGPDWRHLPSPQEYKEAGSIFGTRTHDWSSPSSSSASLSCSASPNFFQPIPVFCPPNSSTYNKNNNNNNTTTTTNIKNNIAKNNTNKNNNVYASSFGIESGRRSVSASAALSSPSPTITPINSSRLVSPTFSDSVVSQSFSLSPTNSTSNSSESSLDNSASSATESRILSPNMTTALSSDLVKEQDEDELVASCAISHLNIENEKETLNSCDPNLRLNSQEPSNVSQEFVLNNASSLNTALLSKKISNVIHTSTVNSQFHPENVSLPESSSSSFSASSSSCEKPTPALNTTQAEQSNCQDMGVVESSLLVDNKQDDLFSETDNYINNTDARSVFSFEEDSKMGRNSSINYHKPATLNQSEDLASAKLDDYDDIDDLEYDEMAYDEMDYDCDDQNDYIEDDSHLFGESDLDSTYQMPPRAYFSRDLHDLSEHEDEDDLAFPIDNSTDPTSPIKTNYPTSPIKTNDPTSPNDQKDQSTQPTTPNTCYDARSTPTSLAPNSAKSSISARGLSALRYQHWISQSSLLAISVSNSSSTSSLALSAADQPSGSSSPLPATGVTHANVTDPFPTIVGKRGTSRSSVNSTSSADSVNSCNSAPSLNNMPMMQSHNSQKFNHSNGLNYNGYGTASTVTFPPPSATLSSPYSPSNYIDSKASPYLSTTSLDDDTHSITSTNYCSAVDYDEQTADVQTELGQDAFTGSNPSLETSYNDMKNYSGERNTIGGYTYNNSYEDDYDAGEDTDDFDDSLLDEVNAIPEDYGDSDDDIFSPVPTNTYPSLPALSRNYSSGSNSRFQNSLLTRSTTYGRGRALTTSGPNPPSNTVAGLRKAKSYSFDKSRNGGDRVDGSADKGTSVLRRQTSIIHTESTTTTLFSPLSKRDAESYYKSIPKVSQPEPPQSEGEERKQGLCKKLSTGSTNSNADTSISSSSSSTRSENSINSNNSTASCLTTPGSASPQQQPSSASFDFLPNIKFAQNSTQPDTATKPVASNISSPLQTSKDQNPQVADFYSSLNGSRHQYLTPISERL